MEELRLFLYPLGYLATLLFGARFTLQWLQSELKGESYSSKLFWHLSLTGNCLLALHCLVQVQYPICCVQVANGWIAWTNLQLLERGPSSHPIHKFTTFSVLLGLVTFLFFIQGHLFPQAENWLRIPQTPWQHGSSFSLHWGWHVLGIAGYLLFSLRFWVQWWRAEKEAKSTLSLDFWWFSLVGALLSCAYFWKMGDSVNLIGPLVGLPAYIRNIQLLKKRAYS